MKFLFLLLAFPSWAQDSFKLYCLVTPEYEEMYQRYFLPSVQDPFEIVAKEYPQECPSGIFQSEGWNKTMLHKLETLLEAIDEEVEGQILFYSDIDILFLRPILSASLDYLGDLDIVIQQAWPKDHICAGFFALRANHRTRRLMQLSIDLLKQGQSPNDQAAMEMAMQILSPSALRWAFLPSQRYPTGKKVMVGALEDRRKKFTGSEQLELDPEILLFHANGCVGLKHKYLFLDQVKQQFLDRQYP